MIQLVYDWIGPEGPWPNGQSLTYFTDPASYTRSQYSVANSPHPYNLESHRHNFTYPKLVPALEKLGIPYVQRPITDFEGPAIYEITPLMKPDQWLDEGFMYVSELALKYQRAGQLAFVINDIYEGYSNQQHNFYRRLHDEIHCRSLNPAGIFYVSLNSAAGSSYDEWCEQHNVTDRINIVTIYIFESYIKTASTLKDCHYILLNRTPTPIRQALVYELWRRNLLQYGVVSMPSPDNISDERFDPANVEFFGFDSSQWNEFIAALPFVVDTDQFEQQNCSGQDILDAYSRAIYSVIIEQTYDATDCIKFTEKTFRAINGRCIPLYFNAVNVYDKFNELGYRAVDFSYSSEMNVNDRLHAFVDAIEQLCQIDINQLSDATSEIADHNIANIRDRDRTALLNEMQKIMDFVNA